MYYVPKHKRSWKPTRRQIKNYAKIRILRHKCRKNVWRNWLIKNESFSKSNEDKRWGRWVRRKRPRIWGENSKNGKYVFSKWLGGLDTNVDDRVGFERWSDYWNVCYIFERSYFKIDPRAKSSDFLPWLDNVPNFRGEEKSVPLTYKGCCKFKNWFGRGLNINIKFSGISMWS